MKVILKVARLAFAQIWEPKAMDAKSEPRCNCALLFDPKDAAGKAELNKVVQAMQQVATELWKDKAPEIMKSLRAKGDLCLHDGATKSEYDGFDGMYYVSASNKVRPVVVDQNKNPLTQADGKPYSGCYVNASLDIWAQDNKWGKRVNAKLIALQFVKDGDAFTGGESYTDTDFEAEDGGPASDNDDGFFGGSAAPAPAPATNDDPFGGSSSGDDPFGDGGNNDPFGG